MRMAHAWYLYSYTPFQNGQCKYESSCAVCFRGRKASVAVCAYPEYNNSFCNSCLLCLSRSPGNTAPIWLANASCDEATTSLCACAAFGSGRALCGADHARDVGVLCSGQYTACVGPSRSTRI